MTDDSMQCPQCQHLMEPVRVAGHTECPFCHRVVDEWCSGETVHIAEESEPQSDREKFGAYPGQDLYGSS